MAAPNDPPHTPQSPTATPLPSSPMPPPTKSGRKTVVTSPPWARIEPPTPNEERTAPSLLSPSVSGQDLTTSVQSPSEASFRSTSEHESPRNSWWSFVSPGQRDVSTSALPRSPPLPSAANTAKDRDDDNNSRTQYSEERDRPTPIISPPPQKRQWSRTSWSLFDRDRGASPIDKEKRPIWNVNVTDGDGEGVGSSTRNRKQQEAGVTFDDGPNRPHKNTLQLQMPNAPQGPFTMSQAKTPGWDSPWVPHTFKLPPPDNAHFDGRGRELTGPDSGSLASRGSSNRRRPGKWGRRRKNIRTWVLYHNYVPLLIRILNIAFTTSTLAIAIRIRRLEHENNILGSLGSSVTLAIIFSPLTLAHVIVSIYLEYFGRPVGLWRTSAKLAHTLLETVFICAWSASLSLCFDNYFTSLLNCSPTSSTRWWSELPPPKSPLAEETEGSLADNLCSNQIKLICVVFISLSLYCCNLFISLFRIIEKVKYHAPPSSSFHV